jgi:hypothetical protein
MHTEFLSVSLKRIQHMEELGVGEDNIEIDLKNRTYDFGLDLSMSG